MGTGADQELELPLLALRGLVVFPHMVSPLEVGRPRSVAAVDEAMMRNRLIVLAAQRDPKIAEPAPADVHDVGVVAEVKQLLRMPEGKTRVLVEGLYRARLVMTTEPGPSQGAMHARVAPIQETDDGPGSTEDPGGMRRQALIRSVLTALDEYVRLSGYLPADFVSAMSGVADPGRLADAIAGQIPLPFEEKQMLLEVAGRLERLEKLLALLHRETEVLDVQRRIQSRVRRQMEKTQKEFLLREQMRAIQRELGEGEERDSEAGELRRRIQELKLPEAVREKAEHEVARLEKMAPMSAEAAVIRTYLDWLLALPWNRTTPDRLDLEAAERILDEDHYGLAHVKERVLEFLAVRQLVRSRLKGPILCLVGPPGVGKTSLARSVARALERKFVRFSLGGVRDEAEIRGHRRTYVGAMPGKIVQALRQAGTRNPVMLLDEVDKMSYDFRGDPAAALLEVLDPEQNHAFSDHYLELPIDLSDVLFITTGNLLQAIPRALRDRMEVIAIPGYTEFEKVQIARRHLIPRQLRDHGLSPKHLSVAPGAVTAIVRAYTREAGVRELERQLAAICRKTARRVVEDPACRLKVTAANLHRWLGPPRYHDSPTEAEDRVGLALGLAYTDAGGDLLSIEVAVVPGRGKLWLTGKLGEVMRESAQASYSYVRSRAEQLGIPPGFYERLDIHVHVPEGAIPKDGPSAGVSMAVALVSALTGRPVRRDVALTGEITLRGRVLPVGGVKEKLLAAHRYGIEQVVLPVDNLRDAEEIPANVRRQLTLHPVSHMDEVLRMALAERPVLATRVPVDEKTAVPVAPPAADVGGDAMWPETA
ncbi:MAG: endopeptidase La [Limnochordaceae bacterium]|nr:endopeptidase La [Limnochordaceae bacterium]